jgi:hypothetical protein
MGVDDVVADVEVAAEVFELERAGVGSLIGWG